MMCWICGTEKEEDFTSHHKEKLCDSCYAVFNYFYMQSLMELRYSAENLGEAEFIEALTEFAYMKCDEYNENLRKERENACNI